MLKVPSKPSCSVCGLTIPAGSGLFIASSQGPEPLPGLAFVHSSGACPKSAGCVEGSGTIFGEIRELAAVIWEGSSTVACHGGPVYLRARGTGGWAAVGLLEALVVLLGAAVVGLAFLPLIAGRF